MASNEVSTLILSHLTRASSNASQSTDLTDLGLYTSYSMKHQINRVNDNSLSEIQKQKDW